jgi:hypothetical protein
MNFKTGLVGFLQDFRYGDQPFQSGVSLTEGTDFTLLDNHSAILPAGSNRLYDGIGDEAMTGFTFTSNSGGHWSISTGGYRWEMDNWTNNASKNTYHQIWVRADKA